MNGGASNLFQKSQSNQIPCGFAVAPGTFSFFLNSRWPKHSKSSLPAVALSTAGVRLLVPSGLSYYFTTHKKHLPVFPGPKNSPGTKQLVRGRRGSPASGASCIKKYNGPLTRPAWHTLAQTPLVLSDSTATWGPGSTAPSRTACA